VPARSRARKKALDILYAAELRGENPVDSLQRMVDAGEGPSNPYASFLVGGVVDHQQRIDELLTHYSQGWALNRMPAVDRTALRIGVFELLWADDVPDAVAVDEAVSLVRELSTDDSPAFVNGVLGTMLKEKDHIAGSAP
jgi:transcription antitermination protein NusB